MWPSHYRNQSLLTKASMATTTSYATAVQTMIVCQLTCLSASSGVIASSPAMMTNPLLEPATGRSSVGQRRSISLRPAVYRLHSF
jgi:hypothetical protein